MDLFIASNRQLPIRYFVNEAIWIRRGGCSKHPQLTLPFFVEVEIKNSFNLQIITEYIYEFQRQYKQTEIQILIKDTSILDTIQEMLINNMLSNHSITIQQL
ncbi:hypothetical protein FJQ98_07745 [Lysinibacillus agricola]|uniref:Uncharacterized protein n=1 Tax=Lysinibacillus agricola TaxID=2590012 RepID=A0ABX7AVZ1_9BACI|nr:MULTISPECIES: hypothetical protein [Lysinibacillus]KOS62946.1 hypothetical protein AN161_11650 [Lysinibacillus sp. FJAT-14222]QQP13916.1 hypothetical protein FJQ98_07745 [Lysinibacillus agricola]